MGVKGNKGFCEKVWRILKIGILVNCGSCEGEAVLKMSKCDVITLACEALSRGQLDVSKKIIKERYPFDMVETKQWNYSKTKILQIFVRDGFIDRHSGEKLVFPGALRVLSELMPKEFPYYEGPARQRAVSFWSIGSWGGSGLCSLFGGAVASTIGWRWIFWMSIKMGTTQADAAGMQHYRIRYTFDLS